MFDLAGPKIITSPSLTETRTHTITRRFAPGARKGKDQSAVKSWQRTFVVPSTDAIYLQAQHALIVHPAYYEVLKQVVLEIEADISIAFTPL